MTKKDDATHDFPVAPGTPFGHNFVLTPFKENVAFFLEFLERFTLLLNAISCSDVEACQRFTFYLKGPSLK